MKNLFLNLITFIALSVAFSNLTACSNTESTQKETISDNTQSNSNTDTGKTKTEYPPAPTGILQADIKDVDGKTFKIADKKDKVVLINLWATWCGPCRSEMPELVALQDKYRDKNFEILGLDVDEESVEEIKAFGKDMKLNYTLGYADEKLVSEIIKLSRQSGIPQSVLINRQGQLAGVFFGAGNRSVASIKESVEKAVGE